MARVTTILIFVFSVSLQFTGCVQDNPDIEFLRKATSDVSVKNSDRGNNLFKSDGQVLFWVDFDNQSDYKIKYIVFTFTVYSPDGVKIFEGFKTCHFERGNGFPDLKPGKKLEYCTITDALKWESEKRTPVVLFNDEFGSIVDPTSCKVEINDYLVLGASDADKEYYCDFTINDQIIIPE